MELYLSVYYCEKCNKPDRSSVGDPRYSFERGLIHLLVCEDCLKELEQEEKENEENDTIQS